MDPLTAWILDFPTNLYEAGAFFSIVVGAIEFVRWIRRNRIRTPGRARGMLLLRAASPTILEWFQQLRDTRSEPFRWGWYSLSVLPFILLFLVPLSPGALHSPVAALFFPALVAAFIFFALSEAGSTVEKEIAETTNMESFRRVVSWWNLGADSLDVMWISTMFSTAGFVSLQLVLGIVPARIEALYLTAVLSTFAAGTANLVPRAVRLSRSIEDCWYRTVAEATTGFVRVEVTINQPGMSRRRRVKGTLIAIRDECLVKGDNNLNTAIPWGAIEEIKANV